VAAPASTAYYGPRFDYDPVTLAPKGLLIEEQRTQLLLYSAQFDDASWTKSATTTLTSGRVDPAGGSSAFTLTAFGGGATVQQAPTVTSGVALSASVWVKRRTGTGVISMRCGDATTIPITVTDSWTRVSISATPTSTAGRMAVLIATDGDEVDIYGAQLEVGSFSTSYIPSVASQVTRAADNASMIGNNFARWYRQDQGSFYAEVQSATDSPDIVVASDTTVSNRFGLLNNNNLQARVTSNGVSSSGDAGTFVAGFNKVAGSASVSDGVVAALNGATSAAASISTMPPLNTLRIGSGAAGNFVGGVSLHISRIAYYNRRLANSELQGISS